VSRRTLAPLAAVLGLVLAGSAAGGAAQHTPTLAEAAGSDAAPPVDPSLIAVRLTRAEAALSDAAQSWDAANRSGMLGSLKAARSQATRALNAARYLVKTVPPTPVGDDGFADGGAPVGIAYAGPEDTLFSVLVLEHDVAATTIGLLTAKDAKTASIRTTWVSAVVSSYGARNKAIEFIHSRKANAPTFATLMPGLLPMFRDELQQINGRLTMNKFGPKLRASLKTAVAQVKKARKLVNTYWPPIPGD